MSDGEAWLDALSEQLRETEEGIPVLATAQSDLQGVDVSSISTFQARVLGWHTAVANAARAVLGARLSRAAPVFANAMAWASSIDEQIHRAHLLIRCRVAHRGVLVAVAWSAV